MTQLNFTVRLNFRNIAKTDFDKFQLFVGVFIKINNFILFFFVPSNTFQTSQTNQKLKYLLTVLIQRFGSCTRRKVFKTRGCWKCNLVKDLQRASNLQLSLKFL